MRSVPRLRPSSRPGRHEGIARAAVLLLLVFSACGGEQASLPQVSSAPDVETDGEPSAAMPSARETVAEPPVSSRLPTVVFLGDSLTAGYQLPEELAWPALLEERFADDGLPFRGVNAGVSGDTSAGALARLDWVLRAEPDVVVVELGANDALRGQDLQATEANIREIVERLRDEGVATLLVGLQIPPNYGPDYAHDFTAIFPRLAEEHGLPLVPFLLEGVGGDPELNLGDGVHPNAQGHRVVADTVAPYLRPLVEEAGAGDAAAK